MFRYSREGSNNISVMAGIPFKNIEFRKKKNFHSTNNDGCYFTNYY